MTNKHLSKVTTLKIDKDLIVSRSLLQDWVRLIVIPTCKAHGVIVQSVDTCSSQHKGFHVYVAIAPPIHAELAWRLQFLLGDDCSRVSLNRARLGAGFSDWNKLFEKIHPMLRTVYKRPVAVTECRYVCLAVAKPSVASSGVGKETAGPV
jgi:hypothetical protein